MKPTVIIKEATIRQWVRQILSESEPSDAKKKKNRSSLPKMSDYAGKHDARERRTTTVSRMGKDDAGSEYQRILQHHADPEVKIGAGSFDAKTDDDYEGSKNPVWTSKDLPIDNPLKTTSGIALDIRSGLDKVNLSQEVPEYVLKMIVTAVNDYKVKLEDSMKILRMALRDYRKDISEDMTDEELADIDMSSEEVNLDSEEKAQLNTDRGLTYLISSPEFIRYFYRWSKGSYKSPHGGPDHHGAPPHVTRYLQTTLGGWFNNPKAPLPAMMKSAMALVKNMGTLNINDDEPSMHDLASELGLAVHDEPQISKVDRYLILKDPNFRYFLDKQGTYYWDWVRNNAEKAGKYTGWTSQF